YPADPKLAYRQLRQATLTGTMEIPDVDFERDIGGYAKVKKQIKQEILDILGRRDRSTSEEEVRRMEDLIPRGMILWGPPGAGQEVLRQGNRHTDRRRDHHRLRSGAEVERGG